MFTVLVVEDTPSERELISHYLREGGYNVISAGDAKEGLQTALEKQPDVIITDIVMPGMNGFELSRSLKKNPLTQKLPIVVCTSKNQELDRLWGMKQGVDVYLTKPFSRQDLLNAVNSVIAKL
jgi:two-component system, chemotaxis family, response regulator PixH